MIIMAASSTVVLRAASRAGAAAAPVRSVRIDFTGARSKDAMLAVAAKALKFPRHFGMNLDALHDSLTDMTFGAGTTVMTLVKLAHTPGGESVYGVFRAAARYWAKQGARVTLTRE